MKVFIKISLVLIIFIFIISSFLFNINSYSFNVNDLSGDTFSNTDATNFANTIITLVTFIGSIVSVIVLIILGIKYMIGSAEEKAEYKKSMMPYLIGAALTFSASVIAGIVYNIAKNLG